MLKKYWKHKPINKKPIDIYAILENFNNLQNKQEIQFKHGQTQILVNAELF